MKCKTLFGWLWVVFVVVSCSIVGSRVGYAVDNSREIIYQVATLGSLLEGVYDGAMTFGKLKMYGDTGIGTFNGLDGEMIYLDSQFYQIKADGVVYQVAETAKTPFAVVTFFDADQTLSLKDIQDFAALTKVLNNKLPTSNIFYAIRVDGEFDFVKVRSVPKQVKPYPVLTEVTKNQPVFEYRSVKGTLIGIYCPPYTNGINMPGYHFHFISADRKAGGHLLDCQIATGSAVVDATHEFKMTLPDSGEFYQVDLSGNKEELIKKVER